MSNWNDDNRGQAPDRDRDNYGVPDRDQPRPDRDWERITPSTDRPLREDYPGPGITPPSPWPEDSDE